jgi:small subunit ribosomal protein S9
VLEEQRSEGGEYDEYGEYVEADAAGAEEGEPGEEGAEPAPVAHTPLELAADARYNATGKRKSAIARVILKPGEGTYTVNGRHLDEYFPRVRLQRMASQPLEAAGYATRMDVVARIHGGGVSAQANALRHGIARALVEADPALRTELKRRGYLTRDPRQKERKKAGLKKARKRPQFSKR